MLMTKCAKYSIYCFMMVFTCKLVEWYSGQHWASFSWITPRFLTQVSHCDGGINGIDSNLL